jgi:hypothetical protein
MSFNEAPVRTSPPARGHEDRLRADPDSETPVVLDKVRARQGVTGHNVRYVLGFGLAAAVIALAAILVFSFIR